MNVGTVSAPVYRSTKDVPFIISTGPGSAYLEFSNFQRENVSWPLDTLIARSCFKYFRATLQDGRTVAINKDMVRRLEPRTGNRSLVFMLHTPTRYDLIESVVVIEGRMQLCASGGGGGSPQLLYLQGDSLYITQGNGVPLDSMFAGAVYVAGPGIDITGNVITNIGDTNPNDDVLKTTNHDGDVTGVYNNLVIKDGVITINKLDSANVLNWLIDNFPLIDTSDLNLTNLLLWVYNNVDTTDLDEQTLYVSGDSVCITNGNCVEVVTGGMIAGERGETMWYDGSEWVADSTIYNDGVQVGIGTDTLFPGRLTIFGDTIVTFASDNGWMRVVQDGDNMYLDRKIPGWLIFKDSADFTGPAFLRTDNVGWPKTKVALPGTMLGISGSYTHLSGEQVELQIGFDSLTQASSVFAPPGGTGRYTGLKIRQNINQIFGGTGITRGIHIEPLISNAFDYRAIDLSNPSGVGLYQSGSLATNRIRGRTTFGSLLSPARDIHNYGQTRLQGVVPGADGLAGIHLSNGDVSHVALGSGLFMSGDTLYANVFGPDGLNGQGTENFLAKWTPDSVSLGNSQFFDNGVNVGLATTSPARKLHVAGDVRVTGSVDTAGVTKVWMANAAGDLRQVNKGNIKVQGDSVFVGVGPGAPYYLARWMPDSVRLNHGQVYDSVNVGINLIAPTSKLQVRSDDGQASVFRAQTATNQSVLDIRADGTIQLGANANTSYFFPSAGPSSTSITSQVIGMYSRSTTVRGYMISGVNLSPSAGLYHNIDVYRGFTGTSASGFSTLSLMPIINQASGATGRTYGLYVNPTLTNAPDWVGLQLIGSGTGVRQHGAAVNYFQGSTMVGDTAGVIRTMQVQGDMRVTGNVDTAAVTRLWAGNTAGDLRRVKVGPGLQVSGDTLSAPYYWALDDGSNDAAITSGQTLTVLGAGSVTAAFDTTTRTLTITGLGPAGSGGEINLGLNVGPGAPVYKGKTDTTLLFRTLVDQGIAEVTQVGDSIIINVPAQTLSVSNDSIFISLGNGVKVPNVPPAGTVLNSTLRWDGAAWVENDSLLVNSQGEAGLAMPISTARSLTTRKDIEVNGVRVGRGNNAATQSNTAVGNMALNSITNGAWNTAIGADALRSATSGNNNTVVGFGAAQNNNGNDNTVVGRLTMGSTNSATGNTILGYGAMQIVSSDNNTAVGRFALASTTTSGSNTATGAYSGFALTGAGNTFNAMYGMESARNSTGIIGSSFFGAGSGYNSTSKHSVFVGRNSGYFVTKDSTLFIHTTSDTVGTIVGDFGKKRVGVNRNPWGIAQTLDVGGTARVRVPVDTAAIQYFWVGNTVGDLRKAVIGDGLAVEGDTIVGLGDWELVVGADSAFIGGKLNVQGAGVVSTAFNTATKTLTISSTGAGEENVGANIGTGAAVYSGKVDTTLQFRRIQGAALTTVNESGNSIVVSTPAQTLSTSSDSIFISSGNGVKVPPTRFGSGTTNYVAKWSQDTLTNSQIFDNATNVGIGVASDLTGRLMVRGLGNSTGVLATFERQDGADVVVVTEDRQQFGSAAQRPFIAPVTSINGYVSIGENQLGIYGAVASSGSNRDILQFANMNVLNYTSGITSMMATYGLFSPSSGTGAFTSFKVAPTINQSEGTGITRGVYVVPTLTSAADFRAVETSNNTGMAFYGAGTAESRLGGRLRVGSTTTALRTLDVTGTLRVSQNVDTATVSRLWGGNTAGDHRRVIIGSGLTISNDTIRASGGGMPYDSIKTPVRLVGVTAGQDTLTDVKYTLHDYESTHYNPMALSNVHVRRDTLVSIRGSYLDVYRNGIHVKTVAAGNSDTLRMSTLGAGLHDFQSINSSGGWRQHNGPEETPLPGYDYFNKLFVVTGRASVSSDGSNIQSGLELRVNGFAIPQCRCEWTGNPVISAVSFTCLVWLADQDVVDLRLMNLSGSSNQYIVHTRGLTMNHIKSRMGQNL